MSTIESRIAPEQLAFKEIERSPETSPHLLDAFATQRSRIEEDFAVHAELINKLTNGASLTEEETHTLKVVIERTSKRLHSLQGILSSLARENYDPAEREQMGLFAAGVTEFIFSEKNLDSLRSKTKGATDSLPEMPERISDSSGNPIAGVGDDIYQTDFGITSLREGIGSLFESETPNREKLRRRLAQLEGYLQMLDQLIEQATDQVVTDQESDPEYLEQLGEFLDKIKPRQANHHAFLQEKLQQLEQN